MPDEDRLVVVSGLLGAYPSSLSAVSSAELEQFVKDVIQLNASADYRALRARFGVLRSNPEFWPFSDHLQRDHLKRSALHNGLLDYTRVEPN